VRRLPHVDRGPRLVGPLMLLGRRRRGARGAGGSGGRRVERGVGEHHRLLGPRPVLGGDAVGGHRGTAKGAAVAERRDGPELDPGPHARARRRRGGVRGAAALALLLPGAARAEGRANGRARRRGAPGPGRWLRGPGLAARDAGAVGHRDDVPRELTGLHDLQDRLAEQHRWQRHPPPLRVLAAARAAELAVGGPLLRRRAAPHPAAGRIRFCVRSNRIASRAPRGAEDLPGSLLLASQACAEVPARAAWAEANARDDLSAAGRRVLQLLKPRHAPVHLRIIRGTLSFSTAKPIKSMDSALTFFSVSLTSAGLSAAAAARAAAVCLSGLALGLLATMLPSSWRAEQGSGVRKRATHFSHSGASNGRRLTTASSRE
jgi:hypothetical protein